MSLLVSFLVSLLVSLLVSFLVKMQLRVSPPKVLPPTVMPRTMLAPRNAALFPVGVTAVVIVIGDQSTPNTVVTSASTSTWT